MKLYLAATAPSNEGTERIPLLQIPNRLLSFHHIVKKALSADIVFQNIMRSKNENK